MSTDLSSWKSLAQAYTPGWNSEGYDAYIKTLPKGVFPVDESDWRQSAFQGSLKDKYTEYKNGGGGLSFEDYTAGTSTNPLMATGANDGRIRNNVIGEAHSTINEGSVAQGGGITDKQTIVDQANAGLIEIPGYTSEALGNVPEMSVDTDKGGVPTIKDNPLDTGTNQKDEYDILTGTAKDGNGTDITPTTEKKEEAKSIFDKASGLFGDIFSAADLKRMTLYTLGGLMTGGSLGGSFKWAGLQVMNEQQAASKNAATLGAAANKAALKEPVELKVEGSNKPIMGRWNGKQYVAIDGTPLPLHTVPWKDTYSAKSMKERHVGVIKGLETGTSDPDGNPVNVGALAEVVYNKYLVQVDEWSRDQGYHVDLSSPLSSEILRIATQQAIEANRGKVDGFVTPESFFEGALIRGVVSGQGGSQNIFKAPDGDSISVKANEDMVAKIETIRKHGVSTGKNSSTATVMANVFDAWMGRSKSKAGKGLDQTQRDAYNDSAGEGQSGFIRYLMSLN